MHEGFPSPLGDYADCERDKEHPRLAVIPLWDNEILGEDDMLSSGIVLRSRVGLAVLSILLATGVAVAQDACANIEQPMTDALKQEYATLAAAALADGETPDQIEVDTVLQSGGWSVAYVTPAEVEPGYMFFEEADGKKQFKDVWGGFATVSEQPETAKWAEALGAPADLSACFASLAASAEDDE
jgi:hypothetical protein